MRPEGAAGRAFGLLMEWLNGRAYRTSVRMLAPADGERFLEIGFGTGRLVELLLASADGVEVAGVDPAETMVDVASRRRRIIEAAARVDLRRGADLPLAWSDGRFDGAAALHCFQFWPQPERTVEELFRLIRPGGRLLLVLRDHARRPPAWLPNPLSRSRDELGAANRLLAARGFRVVASSRVGSSDALLAIREPTPAAQAR